MFPKLIKVEPLEDFKLHLCYNDGAEGIFDFAATVGFYGVFEKLSDPALFRRARISRDVWKALECPGEIDLDPVTVYADVTGKSVEWILAQDEPPKPSRKRSGKRVGVEAGKQA
ncbi:MAG: DUF2442 domain-containing protein [Candidatus Hatepunaea meridiana]|nr:DUF2442 domain-containing protein [Candidatus Hatepunaea meridiana]